MLRLRFIDLEDALILHYVQLPRKPHMDCRPECVDLALMDECRVITDVSGSQSVTHADFDAIVPRLSARWEEERKEELTNALRPHLPSLPKDTDPLGLAIAVFPCRCPRMMRGYSHWHYPAVLGHPCSRSMDYLSALELGELDTYTSTVINLHSDGLQSRKRYPFGLKQLVNLNRVLAISVKAMCSIVAALGLDPATATVNDLKNCEGRVRCRTCQIVSDTTSENNLEARVYSWEAAVSVSSMQSWFMLW